MEMACSAPFAVSYCTACPCASIGAPRSGVKVNSGSGGSLNGQVQVTRFVAKSTARAFKGRKAAVAEAGLVVDAVEEHTSDPNEMFWFDLMEYEASNGPVCLVSFVPRYEATDFKKEDVKVEQLEVVSDVVIVEEAGEVSSSSVVEEVKIEEAPVAEPEKVVEAAPEAISTPALPLRKPQSPFARYPDLKPPTSPTPTPPRLATPAAASQPQMVVSEPLPAPAVAEPEPVVVVESATSAKSTSRPWTPLKPQSPYTGFPDLKPPVSPTPKPPSFK